MFVDEAKINVKGGNGGNGCVSTHREIYVPHGGPSGGNGGHGGSIYLEGSKDMNTLSVFKKRVHIKAQRGQHGRGKRQQGKEGKDTVVKVPLGTVVYDVESGKTLGDIVRNGQKLLVAEGGRGGRGNAAFATPFYRVPRFAEKGEEVKEKWIRLELRSIAHIGLVGLPNAGKSTFLSLVTAAKPKIADYPFTTLSPNLGVIQKDYNTRYIFADIPGLIKGASKGTGLGHKFLRHISRTKLFIHLIDLSRVDPNLPLSNYEIIINELREYNPNLLDKPMVIAANKIDIVGIEESFFAIEKALKEIGIKCFPISAATGEGIDELLKEAFSELEKLGEDDFSIHEDVNDFIVVDETTEKLKQFEIKAVEDYFVVYGKNPERMVQMTDLDNDEAVYHLQQRLQRMGVEEELKKMGARDGNFVVIGDYEFQYYEEK